MIVITNKPTTTRSNIIEEFNIDYKMIADYFATPLSTVTVQDNGFLIEEDGTYLSLIHTPSFIIVFDGVCTNRLHCSVSSTYPSYYTEWNIIDHLREDLENMEEKFQAKIQHALAN